MEEPDTSAPAPSKGLEVDPGNLLVSDPVPLDAAEWAAGSAAACHSLASRLMQALVARLFALPSEPAPGGRLVQLPPPALALPREKPIPKPRPPTKWELFAQRKGIQKRKRSSVVFDEGSQEWKRRYGYQKANDAAAVPILEAKPGDAPGEDPFMQQRAAKKQRIAAQDKRQLANLKAGVKAGGKGTLPPTLKLAAALPEHGRGAPAKRKELKGELTAASRAVSVSTASAGKFDRKLAGERPQDRPASGRKKKFAAVAEKGGVERERTNKTVDHILRKNADDIVDYNKAITKLESSAREERHRMKNKKSQLGNVAPKGKGAGLPKASRGGKAGGGRGAGGGKGPGGDRGGAGRGGGGKAAGGRGGKGRKK